MLFRATSIQYGMITLDNATVGALEFTIHWENDGITHEEWFLGRKLNPANDIFPRGMREALEGKQEGDSVELDYEPRMCIPRYRNKLVRPLPLYRLRKKTRYGQPIIPRQGRFYPQGHIDGLQDIYPDTLTPFRLVGLDDTTFTADCNHPLAQFPISIKATIQHLARRDVGTFGSITHWRETTCDWGPGMQTRHEGRPTDFFLPGFFDRKHTPDLPFSPPAPDAKARENLERTYARFLGSANRILEFSLGSTMRPDGIYDGAVCTLSMEYMTDPVTILQTVGTHLATGSPVLIGFSNHFDTDHAIHGWQHMHEFERMGLVLEYLRLAGLDTDAHTVSIRNDWRPENDPKFMETRGVSDPVYVVCGHKAR